MVFVLISFRNYFRIQGHTKPLLLPAAKRRKKIKENIEPVEGGFRLGFDRGSSWPIRRKENITRRKPMKVQSERANHFKRGKTLVTRSRLISVWLLIGSGSNFVNQSQSKVKQASANLDHSRNLIKNYFI